MEYQAEQMGKGRGLNLRFTETLTTEHIGFTPRCFQHTNMIVVHVTFLDCLLREAHGAMAPLPAAVVGE